VGERKKNKMKNTMKLYEINDSILDLIDEETGEILDTDKYDSLQMAREEKLTNIALLFVNMKSDIKQYKEMEKYFKEKRQRAENTMNWSKETLARELAGTTMIDEKKRFSISWRPSEKLVIVDEKAIAEEWKKIKTEYDVAGMKEAIKSGVDVAGAEIVQNQNIQIK
jgi:Xaa-Pro aminopeptidase